jgi:hypothetical protein
MSLLASSEYTRQKTIKRATVEWFNDRLRAKPNQFVFLTLTAKQAVTNVDGNLAATTREDMDREVGKFLKRLDVAVYGNAAKRYGKRLRRIDASHGGADTFKRLHRHLVIELPQRFEGDGGLDRFVELIRSTWMRSCYAMTIMDVSPTASLIASVRYLVKDGGADNLSLANIVL